MKETTAKATDILVVDIVTAPLSQETSPTRIVGDRAWDGHPLCAQVVGFAAAKLTITDRTARVTWYGLESGHEPSVLDYAMDVLDQDLARIVSFGGSHYVLRMLEHRFVEHDIVAPEAWEGLRTVSLDLSDEVALHGHHPRTTLSDVVDMYQLLVHAPHDAHITESAGADRWDPEAVAVRLRSRLDAVIALYAHLYLGPLADVDGSLVMRETADTRTALRIAS